MLQCSPSLRSTRVFQNNYESEFSPGYVDNEIPRLHRKLDMYNNGENKSKANMTGGTLLARRSTRLKRNVLGVLHVQHVDSQHCR